MNLVYLTDIIILLVAAVITVPFSRMAGLGTVPGFLIAGIAVGPSALGLIDNVTEISHLAELGVVLLLFIIGIQLKPSRLWLMRRMVFGMGTLQVLTTGLLLSAAAHFLLGVSAKVAILAGSALALSSTAFVLQILTEQKLLTSGYGRTSIAVLLLQDLAVVPLLALASLLAVPELTISEDIGIALLEALAILALVILGGRFLLHPVLQRVARYGSAEIFTASAVLLVLGTAVLMAKIGLSMAMGAFVAGLLVADSSFRHQVSAEIQPLRGLLLGLFFMSIGMSLELEPLFDSPMSFIGMVTGLILIKAAVLWPLARMFGHKGWTALAISLVLAQSGEFALVLFAVAFDSGVLNEAIFQQLLAIVLLSMLATPLLARLAYRIVAGGGEDALEEEFTDEQEEAHAAIIIVGFGRVGRRIGQILEMHDIDYLALDKDAAIVERERDEGRSVFFADARQPDVFKALEAGEASVIIVAIDDFRAAEEVVTNLHRVYPESDILARGDDMACCKRLHASGAQLAISENLEVSIALAQAVLEKVLGEDAEDNTALERFREAYYLRTRSALEDRE